MVRIHRSLMKRVAKIDPVVVANRAEDYLYAFGVYKRDLSGVVGLASVSRIKAGIKRIDDLEREMIRLEDKMERIAERRAIEAAKLEQDVNNNLAILEEYLEPEEMREF